MLTSSFNTRSTRLAGARYLGSTLLELERRSVRKAIIGVCAARGQATAVYLER